MWNRDARISETSFSQTSCSCVLPLHPRTFLTCKLESTPSSTSLAWAQAMGHPGSQSPAVLRLVVLPAARLTLMSHLVMLCWFLSCRADGDAICLAGILQVLLKWQLVNILKELLLTTAFIAISSGHRTLLTVRSYCTCTACPWAWKADKCSVI